MLLVVTLLRERLSFRGLRKLTKELWQVAHILNAQLGVLLLRRSGKFIPCDRDI
jgi:hypothetical protein